MTKFACRKGCKKPNGMPAYHDSPWECPHDGSYDPQRVSERDRSRSAKKDAVKTAEAAKAGATMNPSPPATSPATAAAPAAATNSKVSPLTFGGGGTAQVVDRTAGASIQVNEDWVLDKEHNKTFWTGVLWIIHKGVDLIDRVLDTPDKELIGVTNPHLFQINPSDEIIIDGAPRRIATATLKSMGNKTLAEAQNMTDSLGALMFLGGVFFGVGEHLIHSYKHSPMLAKRRKEAEEAELRKVNASKGATA